MDNCFFKNHDNLKKKLWKYKSGLKKYKIQKNSSSQLEVVR